MPQPKPTPSAAPIDNSKVSPETQAIMDMFVINGMELIYDEKQAQTMLTRLSAGEDPTKSMAELLLDIVSRIVGSAKDAGKDIPPEVILHGSNVLFGELLKVLEAAGMETPSEEQKTAVWQLFSSMYIDQAIKTGQMTEQEIILLSKGIKQTDEGKKIMQTAKNPMAAVKNLNLNEQGQTPRAEPAPGAMAAPQGGM